MIFIDELQRAFDMMLHPDTATKKRMGLVDALAFYYKYSLIPLIAAVVVSALVATYAAQTVSTAAGLSMRMARALHILGVGGSIVGLIALVWILEPIGFFINSAILQFFGKYLFKEFNKGYESTFSAFMMASAPVILTLWLASLPFIGLGVTLLFGLWSLIALIMALSNQQGTSRLKALLIVIVSDVIAAVALIAVIGIFAGALIGSAL